MINSDEEVLLDYLGEKADYFSTRWESEEILILQNRVKERGNILNPYGVPIQMLGGLANLVGVVDYLAGIYESRARKKATDFLYGWVKTGIDQVLHANLSSNGNALEWYMLEMLILTKVNEVSYFRRPPKELDNRWATDLLYTAPSGLNAGGHTIGIQITSSGLDDKRFREKQDQVRRINAALGDEGRNLKMFSNKRPDVMGIIGIYGKIGHVVKQSGNRMFCRDFGLPIHDTQIPFKEEIQKESQDIADFIRMSINTWNTFFRTRKKYMKTQKIRQEGRDGKYIFEWKYVPSSKNTVFLLKKNNTIVSQFEIFDPA